MTFPTRTAPMTNTMCKQTTVNIHQYESDSTIHLNILLQLTSSSTTITHVTSVTFPKQWIGIQGLGKQVHNKTRIKVYKWFYTHIACCPVGARPPAAPLSGTMKYCSQQLKNWIFPLAWKSKASSLLLKALIKIILFTFNFYSIPIYLIDETIACKVKRLHLKSNSLCKLF